MWKPCSSMSRKLSCTLRRAMPSHSYTNVVQNNLHSIFLCGKSVAKSHKSDYVLELLIPNDTQNCIYHASGLPYRTKGATRSVIVIVVPCIT